MSLILTARLRQAVLQIESLRTELDLTENDLAVAVHEANTTRARLAELENAITWGTSCLNCSRLLDQNYAEFERRERAELKLAKIAEALTETPLLVVDVSVIQAILDEVDVDNLNGRCDTCGNQCDESGCTANRAHVAALDPTDNDNQ